MAQVRQAVGVLLTRNPESTEVYLVRRNDKLRFFGGYDAFPGGKLDTADTDLPILNAQTTAPEHLPYIAAAAREIFEETGVLLVPGADGIPAENLHNYRQQLLADSIDFKTLLAKEKLSIDGSHFHFICSIMTPEFAPVRYDTQFYWVHLPQGTVPRIVHGELVDGHFITAENALKSWADGEALIVPPVVFMLKEMAGKSLLAATENIRRQADAYKQGVLHEVYFTPGVQLIALQTRTLLPAMHTNTYLVGEKDLFIIDPAPSDKQEQQRLWNYLDDQLRQGKKLHGILLTHHHSDHIGAVAACQRRYGLPLMAHGRTAEKLAEFHFQRLLHHGDVLDLGTAPDGSSGWKLRVLHTPGHASGHLAFQENRYGAIMAGDMVSTLSTIVINPPDGHLATYLNSLRQLEVAARGAIYPGHGPAVRDGKKLLGDFIRHRLQREQKLLDALTEQPQTSQELVVQVYQDTEPALWPLAELSLQAGLIKLMEEGKCERDGSGYRLRHRT